MASSMLGKSKVTVDTTVLANGDSLAAYLTDAAGALLTSQAIGGKQRLDANLPSEQAGDTAYSAGSYSASISAVRKDSPASIASADGNVAPLQMDANGALRVSGSLTASFTAEHNEDDPFTNGDSGIATLLVRQDTLASSTSTDGDYGSFKSNSLGELYVHDTDVKAQLVSANSSLSSIVTNTSNTASNTSTISSTLSALSKAEDAVAGNGDQGIQVLAVRKDAQGTNVSNDGDYSSLQTWSEGSLKVVDVANGSLLQQRVALSAVAAKMPAAPLANRKSLMIQNAGSSSAFIGSATVTTSGATLGIEIPKGGFMELEVGPAVDVYGIAGGALNVAILEMA